MIRVSTGMAIANTSARVTAAGGDVFRAFDHLDCGISSEDVKTWAIPSMLAQLTEPLPGRVAKKVGARLAGRATGFDDGR